tara:strand:- start:1731 stop:1862 length:132 start_codon:yes stop_codon:yes gene_type:complete
MHRTFNMGIGMIFAAAPDKVDAVIAQLKEADEQPVILGDLVSG